MSELSSSDTSSRVRLIRNRRGSLLAPLYGVKISLDSLSISFLSLIKVRSFLFIGHNFKIRLVI